MFIRQSVNGMISLTLILRHQVTDVHDAQCSKFTLVFTCKVAYKNHEDPCILVKVIVKK